MQRHRTRTANDFLIRILLAFALGGFLLLTTSTVFAQPAGIGPSPEEEAEYPTPPPGETSQNTNPPDAIPLNADEQPFHPPDAIPQNADEDPYYPPEYIPTESARETGEERDTGGREPGEERDTGGRETGAERDTGGGSGTGRLDNPLRVNSITEFLQAIVNIITIIAVPIIVFFIILAGFKYVTAGGNQEQIKQSTAALTYALVGGVLILGANAIVAIVANLVNSFTV